MFFLCTEFFVVLGSLTVGCSVCGDWPACLYGCTL